MDVLVDRLHEEKDGLKCELTVSTSRQPVAGLLREGRFNVSSATTRAAWVKALEERMPADRFEIDWYAAFEFICARTIRRWRQGEPMIDLAAVTVSPELPYLLHPLILQGAATVLFADGASGKSLMALAACVSIATGEEILPGIQPMQCGPCIYWDWEWDAESHAERLQAICGGAGIEVPRGLIFYQPEVTSIIEAAPRMRKHVAETGAVFAVVDSLGYARGGDANSQDLTTRAFGALRTLKIPVLVLDHVAKNDDRRETSYGSVYTRNSARLMWRLDASKDAGDDNFYTGLINTKWNRRGQKPIGMNVKLESDSDERLISVNFEAADIKDVPGLNKTLSLSDHMRDIITANGGTPLSIDDLLKCLLADGREVTESVVKSTLYQRRRFVRVGTKWSLLSTAVEV